MYWFVNGLAASIIPLVLTTALWACGGWLITSAAFHLRPSERVAIGAGIGLAIHLAVANLLAHLLTSAAAFVVSAILVFLLGLVLCLRERRAWDWRDAWRAWPQVLLCALLMLLF
ncbi:MAG: hypothetical protein NTU91_13370, partial [Chloroflexi bacterium]|nr:hypothetical protein [Chloroflexota bacterium]